MSDSSIRRLISLILESHREATPDEVRSFRYMNTLPQEIRTRDELNGIIKYMRDAENKDEIAVRTLINDILQSLYPTRSFMREYQSTRYKDSIRLDRDAIRQIISDELDVMKGEPSDKDLNDAIELLISAITDAIPAMGNSPDEGKLKENGRWHLERLRAARNDNIAVAEKRSVINKVLDEFRYKTIDDPKNLIGDAIQNVSVEVATLMGAELISDDATL